MAGYHLGRWAVRERRRSGVLGRLDLVEALGQLARVIRDGEHPHGATLRRYVLTLRLSGWSAERLGRLWGVSGRAVRLWSAGHRLPKRRAVLERLRAHAGRLVEVAVKPPPLWNRPFGQDSMAGLLELSCRGSEARLRETAPAFRLAPESVLLEAERIWPSVKGLLASDSRTAVLSTVRQAIALVLVSRGCARAHVAALLGRSESTVSYHVRAGGAL